MTTNRPPCRPRSCTHYGVMTERVATSAEMATALLWLVSNPTITRQVRCSKCGVAL